ncbi:MAG: beta-barrel assembly-enhancing protease [Gammaproteobacteria bacterium]
MRLTYSRLRCIVSAAGLALLPGLASGMPEQTTVPAPISASTALSTAPATPDLNLPKLGLAGGGALPLWKAQFIGREIYYAIQGEDGVLNDPLIADYTDHLGHRLSSVADGPDEPFHYFVINDPDVNAFALPGAFIAVYSGLILATRSEDELAGVLAHETAHVVQRHIARQMDDSRYNDLIDIGILLGAIAIAVAAPDAAAGALMGAQGGIIQRQINYTRTDEMEADRVGIGILAQANFNPEGMVAFFQYMQQQYALQGVQIPEFLSSHPLDITRITEAQMRAKNLHVKPTPENPNYALMRARIRVLLSDDLARTLNFFRTREKMLENPWYRIAAVYGTVLCLNRMDEGKQALALIGPIAQAHSDNVALQLADAESLLAAGDTKAGLAALADDNTLYPSNPAVIMAYARALLNANRPKETLALLAPGLQDAANLLNPDYYRLLASAAAKTGDDALAYLAMAYHFEGRGQYKAAIIQLRLGLDVANLSPARREQMEKMKKKLKADYKMAKNIGIFD